MQICRVRTRYRRYCTELDAIQQALDHIKQQNHVNQQKQDWVTLLKECKSLSDGEHIHARATNASACSTTSFGNALIQMYSRFGSVEQARAAFDHLGQHRDTISWNMMITAYAQNGHLQFARELFDEMPIRSTASWNTMIGAYAQNGDAQEALTLFHFMDLHGEKPVRATFLCLLDSLASSRDNVLRLRNLHARIYNMGYESEVAIATSLIKLYGKCRCPEEANQVFHNMPEKNIVSWTTILHVLVQSNNFMEARKLFEDIPEKNVVSWNTMIVGYARSGHLRESIDLFLRMDLEGEQPDRVTFAAVLESCVELEELSLGRHIHFSINSAEVLSDFAVGTALINLYGKCGRMEIAKACFDNIYSQNALPKTAPHTSIIAHYARHGYTSEAVGIFRFMAVEGLNQSSVLFISVLSAFSHCGKLEDGRDFFLCMIGDYGLEPELDHYLCMVDLLGRTGKLDEAHDLIQTMPVDGGSMAWRNLLAACEYQGDSKRGKLAADRAFPVTYNGPQTEFYGGVMN